MFALSTIGAQRKHVVKTCITKKYYFALLY
nr:MAG TPA: hypothetical protein [Caudoviricetes sp.]